MNAQKVSHTLKGPVDSSVSGTWYWVGAVWTVCFFWLFLQQPLPNNNISARTEILPLLPFAVLDAIDPPADNGGSPQKSPPRGLRFLGERLPLWGIAAVILLTAWSCGTLLVEWNSYTGLTAGERFYFSTLCGLALLSVLTLLLGLAGGLSPTIFRGVHLGLIVLALMRRFRRRGASTVPADGAITSRFQWAEWWWLLPAFPFLVGMLLGSLSPSTDFDVNEYHLGGPKEWYLAGRIYFLEHDIYTSFPFLTEMLLLDGMLLMGDWYWGGIAGQAVLMAFAPLTAMGIALFGRRWFSAQAGAFGALIFLTTPWIFRLSIIPYAEGGLVAYTFAAVASGFLLGNRLRDLPAAGETHGLIPPGASHAAWLTGLAAGSAMACKYTGLFLVVLPWSGIITMLVRRRIKSIQQTGNPAWLAQPGWQRRLRRQIRAVYILGVVLMIGPWLARNYWDTGNPVYPLGYSVFGARDIDPEMAARFAHGHARPSAGSLLGEVRDFGVKLFDVAAVNDWQSPLIFALAPLALLWRRERHRVTKLIALTAWAFMVWWVATHHLDRFWLPLLPTAAMLAGVGAACLWQGPFRGLAVLILVAGVGFNLGFVSTGLVGYNAGLTQLQAASDFATRIRTPVIAWLNTAMADGTLPANSKFLCVGEAELFHARFPYLYNTVFDQSLFEEWCAAPEGDAAGKLRPAIEILDRLQAEGITHLYVNWAEILRYRQPYSYGYTDFVHPARFHELMEAGVLDPPLELPGGLGRQPFGEPESDTVRLARQWAPELIGRCGDEPCLTTAAIYPVRSSLGR